MAEKVCNLIKSGGENKYPDYSNPTTVVDSSSGAKMNWVATADGYLWVITNTASLTVATMFEDGVTMGNVANTVFCPVRKGHTYTTNVNIRQARFIPLK